jgi:hypothetical protein
MVNSLDLTTEEWRHLQAQMYPRIRRVRIERIGLERLMLGISVITFLVFLGLLTVSICIARDRYVVLGLIVMAGSSSIASLVVAAAIQNCRAQLRSLEFALVNCDAASYRESQNALVCYSKLGEQLIDVYRSLARRK